MAGKSNNGSWNNDLQFANFAWNGETDKQYAAWLKADAPEECEALKYLSEAGYRITLQWDTDSSCFRLSIINYLPSHYNTNICITSYSPDVSDVILVALFKEAVLFEGKRAPLSANKMTGRR